MTAVGLYIHTPFCETKCGYCDFYSVALKDRQTAPLVTQLLAELDVRLNARVTTVRTVFVGGGTPTVLPADQLTRLCARLATITARHSVEEFTVEANPATVDDEKLAILTEAGVDRLSMGAQSWHLSELAALERLHTPDDIAPGVALARRYGIERINLDLIFGIPGQTMETWAESLRRTVDLGVEHVACYGLTYEPNTKLTARLRAGGVQPCDEELEAEMYLYALDFLEGQGYQQYETSNYARPGERSLHNLIYWQNDPYVGVGPSAAGCVAGQRYKNVSDINAYVRGMERDGSAVCETEQVTGATLAAEHIMMQLRVVSGIDVKRSAEATGIDLAGRLAAPLSRLRSMGLVAQDDQSIRLTRQGRLVADSVISELYNELYRCESRGGGDRPLPVLDARSSHA